MAANGMKRQILLHGGAPMSSEHTVLDPVCGMLIAPASAAAQREHAGQVYHLCSIGCAAKFDADAAAYIAASRMEGFEAWQGDAPDEMGRL
jgi:YHS domain-containing protein